MPGELAGLQGKVIVITGASDGIGAALATLAGSHGAHVVLAARREEALRAVAAGCGGEALVVKMDVTRREDHARLLSAAVERFGHVDVWVNNAGRGITRPVLALTDEDVDEIMLVNVKSVLYAMHAVVPHFQARGAGHVINVSSMLGRIPLAAFRSVVLRVEARAERVDRVPPAGPSRDTSRDPRHDGVARCRGDELRRERHRRRAGLARTAGRTTRRRGRGGHRAHDPLARGRRVHARRHAGDGRALLRRGRHGGGRGGVHHETLKGQGTERRPSARHLGPGHLGVAPAPGADGVTRPFHAPRASFATSRRVQVRSPLSYANVSPSSS